MIALILVLLTLIGYFWMRKNNDRLPPGPIQLPVLGSAIQLQWANSRYPHLALAKLAVKYGDVMSFGLGMHKAVVVSSYDAVQEIFKKIETSSHRFEFPYVIDRNYGKNLGIIWGYGQRWMDVRRLTKKILNEFGYGKIKTMGESLNESANHLVDCIKTEILDSAENVFSVDHNTFSIHVLNIVWNLAGGYKFDPNDQDIIRNMECVDKADKVFGYSNLYNMFPFLKTWFPKLVHYEEHLNIHNEIHEFTDSLINDAREKRSQRFDSEPTSFIEAFLDKIEEHQGESETVYTHEQLIIVLEDLFLASLLTTGSLLTWSILYLVMHPEVQVKFRQEILHKMKNRTDFIPIMELKALPYVKATILEVMRRGDIGPLSVPRCPTQDVQYGDYLIPKGSALFFNLHVIYNDKTFWKDPENFRPERFINENGQIDKVRSDRILNTVFGVGPRMCLGETVALDSLFTFLAVMIVNFKFDTLPGKKLVDDDIDDALVLVPKRFIVKVTSIST